MKVRSSSQKTIYLALYGVLIALALVLSYAESQIPVFFAVPGMKLGLTNLVVVVALYKLGDKSAFSINLIRILLVSLLFGTVMSLWFSLAGGLLSTLVMIFLKHTNKLGVVVVSMVGGVTHNIGQLLVAMVVLQTKQLGWYLVILWFTGLITGALIGLLGGELVRRLDKIQLGGGAS